MLLRLARAEGDDLKEALMQKADATRHLLASLQQATVAAQPPEKDEVYDKYNAVQTEVRFPCAAGALCHSICSF